MRHFTSVIVLAVFFLQPLFAQDFSNPNAYRTRDLPDGAIARLGKGAIGHGDRAVAFSPDGRLFAVASGIGAWLYNVEDPETSTWLAADVVHSVSFSPDGKKLVTAGGMWTKGEVILWDVATGAPSRIERGGDIVDVSFSPDGRTLAYSARGGPMVKLRDVASRTVATTQGSYDFGFTSLSFSPDGAIVATGHENGTVMLWDVATRALAATLTGHNGEVYSVAFSPDGRTLAAGTSDETVKLWDVATRTNFSTLRVDQPVTTVAFSPDGSLIATGTWHQTVKIWNATTGRNVDTFFSDHRSLIRGVSFSSDGKTLASASDDGAVVLRDLATQRTTTIAGHSGTVLGMAFSQDGATLASYNSSYGSGIKIWDTATRRKITTLRGHYGSPITSISISHDGTTLASASGKTTILWDLETQTEFAHLEHENDVWAVSLSPDGAVLATGGWPGWVSQWNVRTQEQTTGVSGLNDAVKELEFSPGGEMLASGLDNGEIRVWDLTTRKTAAVLEGLTSYVLSISFSSDGTKVYAGSYYETVKVWDLETGSTIATRKPESLNRVAFSTDRTMFAIGSGDGNVRLFDISTGEIISTFEGHAHRVASVLFLPDGKTLASGSADGTILLWDLTLNDGSQTPGPDVDGDRFGPDFDGDGTVGFTDFVRFAANFGLSQGDLGYDERYDLDDDGQVGLSDYLIFAKNFGKTSGN
ncbi:MAG: hypothetical protein OYM47_16520 [Gemmatimonadota bacterium]|nr:hypothetical protein [Gemmatimonadota bacterium]